MPEIHLIDPFGTLVMIQSASWSTVDVWLHEWMPRFGAVPDVPVMAEVRPVFVPAGKPGDWRPDWPADAAVWRRFPVGHTAADALTAIYAERAHVERAAARRKAEAGPQ